MKAAVCWEVGKPLVVEDVVLDPPKTGEVRVPDRRRGHLSQRRAPGARRLDRLDQHPAAGRGGARGRGLVSDVGPGVTRVRPGDRVVVSLLRTCGALPPLPHRRRVPLRGAVRPDDRAPAPLAAGAGAQRRASAWAASRKRWWSTSRSSSSSRPTSGSTGRASWPAASSRASAPSSTPPSSRRAAAPWSSARAASA